MGATWNDPDAQPIPARIWPYVLGALICVGAPVLLAAVIIASAR